MKYINIILYRAWPYIQFNYSYTFTQSLYDWNITSIDAELVPSQIGIVACIYVIVGEWSSHILANCVFSYGNEPIQSLKPHDYSPVTSFSTLSFVFNYSNNMATA
eukprot:TRINITY_DN3949_c0_g1_i2.p1 TRINITY_DN3949_c0_g1~~TRINITY_DN3949_c0_g1_i2.p1  ORF type:complete len:105 (-),score=7.59 TRINITY_DN3949_c0_g1_i2:646-960(-)